MKRPERVAHVVMNVTDLERAQQFYRDALGMSRTGGLDGQMVFLYFGEDGKAPHPFYHDLALYKVDQAAHDDFRNAAVSITLRSSCGPLRTSTLPPSTSHNWV